MRLPESLRVPDVDGRGWLRLDAWATLVFSVAVGLGAAWPDGFAAPATVVSLVLFGAGCVIFLLGFLIGVDRSRTEEVSVAGLYLLMADAAPIIVKRWLLGLLAVQVAVAVAAASIRPFTSLAFGILVPMFGLAITGRWAAEYGAFGSRTVLRTKRAVNRGQRPADEEGSHRA